MQVNVSMSPSVTLRGLVKLACFAGAILTGLSGCGNSESSSTQRAACEKAQWISAWQAPPTDATLPGDRFLTPLISGPQQTYRSILSPLGSGDTVRIHLSNRFGLLPVTFSAIRIARRTTGASIDAATSVQLFVKGAPSVTIPAGADVVTDAAAFHFDTLEDLAVSIAASDPGVVATHHFAARQWSYVTAPLQGDRTEDADGAMFKTKVSIRPFVVGLDTMASGDTSAIVTLGDSLTDGDRSPADYPVHLEDASDIDLNVRYPDFLRRRLLAAGRPVFVSNAGISGNRVLADASPLPSSGPSALNRLHLDVLGQMGVTDVLFWEGINDIGNGARAQDLIDGYIEVIDRLHAQGLHVIQGTLSPAGGTLFPGYDTPDARARRQTVNNWIRTQSPADAIVDFDAAVRDPSNIDFLDPAYNGSDGLHFNAAGYERIAKQIDLASIRGRSCDQ